MAFTSETHDLTTQNGGFFKRILNWFVAIGQAGFVSRGMEARMLKLQELQNKTDAELAKMGLRRDDLVSHVFRDILYV